MTNLSLSLAMGNYDRTRAIVDGTVKIDGVDPVPMLLSPEEMFFRAFRHLRVVTVILFNIGSAR